MYASNKALLKTLSTLTFFKFENGHPILTPYIKHFVVLPSFLLGTTFEWPQYISNMGFQAEQL